MPPKDSPKGESRHHQQGVADCDREGIVGSLGQKQSQQAWARQQPGVQADQRDEQKWQSMAQQVQQCLPRWRHQFLQQQQRLTQHFLHNAKAGTAGLVSEVLTEVLNHESFGVVIGEQRHPDVGAQDHPAASPGDQNQGQGPALALAKQEPEANGPQQHAGVFTDQRDPNG